VKWCLLFLRRKKHSVIEFYSILNGDGLHKGTRNDKLQRALVSVRVFDKVDCRTFMFILR